MSGPERKHGFLSAGENGTGVESNRKLIFQSFIKETLQ